ncbi:MAG: SDR family NAD(P)-dependent oxidoreductase [Planctomycetota bacterium]|nr:SDR family NAD(P)-dependent oxidoreductase [Planctomycetota bacterium]
MTENETPQDTLSLRGRRAVVTGSSSGIGRAIALALSSAGAEVLIHANRSVADGEKLREEITARGARCEFIQADLRTGKAATAFFEEALETLGSLDIWINNAGVDILTGEGAELSYEEKLESLIAVDLRASILLARKAGKAMKDHGGVILNMGWDQAAVGMEGESGELFGAIKGAVMAFTRSLALSLAPEVRVNCLAPGWIRTAWGEEAPAEWQERVLQEVPLGRWGSPEDVASTARFLVSDAAAFISGQVVNINGGAVS